MRQVFDVQGYSKAISTPQNETPCVQPINSLVQPFWWELPSHTSAWGPGLSGLCTRLPPSTLLSQQHRSSSPGILDKNPSRASGDDEPQDTFLPFVLSMNLVLWLCLSGASAFSLALLPVFVLPGT